MFEIGLIEASEQEFRASALRGNRLTRQAQVAVLGTTAVLAWPMAYLSVEALGGVLGWLVLSMSAPLMIVTATWIPVRRIRAERNDIADMMASVRSELQSSVKIMNVDAAHRAEQTAQRELAARLGAALEMAEDETEVLEVVERAFDHVLPNTATVLMIADNSHAQLRVIASSAQPTAVGCGVQSPDHCPATRRAQVLRFSDSNALDACPRLRQAEGQPQSALCVPVSVMGRAVGVVHATVPGVAKLSDRSIEPLVTLANLLGSRLGLIRVMAQTQLQASTDSLTGLLNRRSLENEVRAVSEDGRRYSAVLADLDHFKILNDTFGHETGDRALRVFATTLRAVLRREDLISRHGGEEFVAILPQCSVQDARSAIDHVRTSLAAALAGAGLPPVTASYGIVQATEHEELSEVINRADVALFEAKKNGRDRIVVHVGRHGADRDDVVAPTVFRPRPKPALVLTKPDLDGA